MRSTLLSRSFFKLQNLTNIHLAGSKEGSGQTHHNEQEWVDLVDSTCYSHHLLSQSANMPSPIYLAACCLLVIVQNSKLACSQPTPDDCCAPLHGSRLGTQPLEQAAWVTRSKLGLMWVSSVATKLPANQNIRERPKKHQTYFKIKYYQIRPHQRCWKAGPGEPGGSSKERAQRSVGWFYMLGLAVIETALTLVPANCYLLLVFTFHYEVCRYRHFYSSYLVLGMPTESAAKRCLILYAWFGGDRDCPHLSTC